MKNLIALLLLAGLAWVGYSKHQAGELSAEPVAQANVAPPGNPAQSAPVTGFRCDGRTHCSQMTSCAEAKYFLAHCPNTQMDGNHDGEPCERQWCN